MNKFKAPYPIIHRTWHHLNENQVSKSIDAAKDLYIERTGKSREDADRFVRVDLRNDIDSLRSEKGGKFILGATRIVLDGELTDERTINSFNRTIKLIAAAHANEYDRDLNGETAATLIQRFSGAIKSMDDKDRMDVGGVQYTKNTRYTIVPIDDFDEAKKYGQYTSWCVTHYENMLDSYTNGGTGQFYFCLRDDYKNIPKKIGEGCPLDEYGLSMVAVSVDENGNLHTCTCRWNHDNGGNDNIMDTKQISQLIGQNFYEVFKPNDKWKKILDYALQLLKNGESPREVFDYCCEFHEGFSAVKLNGKWNFIDTDGELLSKQWFDSCWDFCEKFAKVRLNGNWNFINTDGKLLSKQWFDACCEFHEGFAMVRLNGKWNFIDTDGKLLSKQWFDDCWEFHEGFAMVELNCKYNYINTDGELLSKQEYLNRSKKRALRINESQLRQIVNMWVKRALNETINQSRFLS